MCLIGDVDNTEVFLHPMPIRIRGFVTRDADCRCTIIINELLSEEKRAEALLHELKHLKSGHLFSEELVYSIERSVEYNEGNYQIKGQIFSSPLTI